MSVARLDGEQSQAEMHRQWQKFAGGLNRWNKDMQAWLEPATQRMLNLACIGEGSRVLDAAAGQGEQSITAAMRVGPRGYVLVTDRSEDMLALARAAARQAGMDQLETRVVDGHTLELDAAQFDAAICRLGLMFLHDPVRRLAELRRALRSGGRAAVTVLTTVERNPLFSIPGSILQRYGRSPQPVSQQPGLFSLGERGELEAALSAAGFSLVQTHILSLPVHLPSIEACIRFQKATLSIPDDAMVKPEFNKGLDLWYEVQRALSEYAGANGVSLPGEVMVGVGER